MELFVYSSQLLINFKKESERLGKVHPGHNVALNNIFACFRAAQCELKQLLDNLSLKLKTIQKSQQTPVVFDEYVRKLINVKHKVTVVYNVLNTSQVCNSYRT